MPWGEGGSLFRSGAWRRVAAGKGIRALASQGHVATADEAGQTRARNDRGRAPSIWHVQCARRTDRPSLPCCFKGKWAGGAHSGIPLSHIFAPGAGHAYQPATRDLSRHACSFCVDELPEALSRRGAEPRTCRRDVLCPMSHERDWRRYQISAGTASRDDLLPRPSWGAAVMRLPD